MPLSNDCFGTSEIKNTIMKYLIKAVALLIAAMTMSCGSKKHVSNQNDTSNTFVSRDGAQEAVDDLKSRGYVLYGANSMFTLYELINQTRNKRLEDPSRYIAIEGIGEGNDLSSAKLFALNDAAVTYATKAGSVISGKMSSMVSNLTEESRTKIVGVYVQKINEFIMPTLTENYVVGKQNGTKMRILANYMIDEIKAKEVRNKAINSAIKQVETDLALGQDFMRNVDNLINEQPIK